VYRFRAAAEDDAVRPALRQFVGADGVRDDLAVDAGLPDPPGDQLGVLCAEVDDQDGVVGYRSAQWPIPTPCAFWSALPSV
jgi:hypothetical protein